MCCGEGGTLQTNNTGVCRECSLSLSHTGFAPTHGVCAFPVYTVQVLDCSARNCLRWALGFMHLPCLSHSGSASWVLHRGADSVGPAFCALPRSQQLRRPCAWRAHSPQVQCILSPPWSQPLGFPGVPASSVPCVSYGELISGCDPPGECQLSRISGSLWLETGSLFAVW